MSSEAPDVRVLMEGPRSYLREIEDALRAAGIASEIVRPPHGCGSG
ncbi:MAG: hypothetical protein IPN34_14150 [Planctomycetes bacterium]|nr:hypothetical protein [Planctomycetota bacterium]